MCLRRDERKSLSYYHSKVGRAGICQRDPSELENVLCEQTKIAKEQIDERYVMNAIQSLRKNGLIKNHQKVRDTGQVQVDLTQEAINLGRKYSSKTGTLGVWFTEFLRFWVILGVLIGAITLLVTIFKD